MCSRCIKDLNATATAFKNKCDSQNVGAKEVVIDDMFVLKGGIPSASSRAKTARQKAKVTKRVKAPVKHTTPKPKQTKRPKPKRTVVPKEASEPVVKVPAVEFPSEVCDGMNFDPSLEDDYRTVFTPKGSYVTNVKYETIATPNEEEKKPESTSESEDGNVDYCLVCGKSGGLICCDKCPRSFHHNCLNVDKSTLPDRWECPRCTLDATEQDEDTVSGNDRFKDLTLVYANNENQEDGKFWENLTLLSKIQDIIDRLKSYDFGHIFAVPVSVRDVPDYRKVVKRPMDLGTVLTNISKGTYITKLSLLAKGNSSRGSNIDRVILEALKDIELIWHNCLLYNLEGKNLITILFVFCCILQLSHCIMLTITLIIGTSYYRMANVMRAKYYVMRRVNIDEKLNDFIRQQLGSFADECKQYRKEFVDAKNSKNNPWIPFSKNELKVAAIKRGVKRSVAVFDPATNMIIKQYTSMNSAGQAAVLLQKLGFNCEVNTMTPCVMKNVIHKSAMDPSQLIFGYRWLFVEDIRDGKFAVAKNADKHIIRKKCTVSSATLAKFTSIESAYEDWLNTKKKRISLSTAEDKESIECFTEKFIDGEDTIDGIVWKKITIDDEEPSSTVKIEPQDENTCGNDTDATSTTHIVALSGIMADDAKPNFSNVKIEPDS